MTDIQRIKIQELTILNPHSSSTTSNTTTTSGTTSSSTNQHPLTSSTILNTDLNINFNTTSSGSMHSGDKRRFSDIDHIGHNYDPYYDSDDENERPLYDSSNNNRPRYHNTTNNNHNNNNTNTTNSNTVENITDTDTSKNLRAARTFECEARGSLVDRCCKAGDLVNIVGIIKTNNVSISRTCIECISVSGVA